LLLGYLVYPLLNLAISRKREFLADLGSVELTKDANAMISALEKIS
jgi:heat shock protein HtpX